MRGGNWKRLLCAGIGTYSALLCAAHQAAGQPYFGPQEFVKAGGVDIAVPSYSVPSFVHWDDDGLKDLVIGEKTDSSNGKVRVYLNVGTQSAPEFSNVWGPKLFYVQYTAGGDLTCTPSGCLGCFPRVVYWDADARKDLLVGLSSPGNVKLFLNTGTEAAPTFDSGTLLQVGEPGSKTNIDVGYRATSTVVDWNSDGNKDVVAGAYDGKIHVFVNEGTDTAPDFRSETFAQNSGSDLRVPSDRSSPAVLDLDGDGKKDLLAGNTNGEVLLYNNTGTDQAPSFSGYVYVEADGVKINLGSTRSRPFVCDWTGDGWPDLLIGATSGKVYLYQGVPGPIPADFDDDHDVDGEDLAFFEDCATGPAVGPLPPGCEDADFDEDQDVDQEDFGVFQRCLSGEGVYGDPDCAD